MIRVAAAAVIATFATLVLATLSVVWVDRMVAPESRVVAALAYVLVTVGAPWTWTIVYSWLANQLRSPE